MKKNNKIQLSVIEEEIITGEKTIDINLQELEVIKRDGRIEKYDTNKMRRVCLWACDQNENFADSLLSSTRIKLYNRIKIEDVYNELIKTAANKISRITPQYELIASKLLLLKIYKDTWNIKKTSYPDFLEVVKKGIYFSKYNKDVFESYSEDEIIELGQYINQEKDFLFTYKSLYTFYEKYCLNYKKTKKFELPQHVYMRVAMSLFYKEKKDERIDLIKKFYNHLSSHNFTLATPIMLNAGTKNQQLSSCVLMKMDDDSNSIMDTIHSAALYSKNKGGLAIDVSSIRSSGSYIDGNNGFSSGPIPFIKMIESTVKAFNQGSIRPGACAVYFQWWNYNFRELVVLKNNTGTEENRARQLKYSVKINDLLIQRVLNNQDITLFDPKEVPELLNVYGEEFEKKYVEYENKTTIRKITMPARELIYLLFKERAETGNIYLFHEENVNKTSMLNRYINSSNLCCEITLPSVSSRQIDNYIYTKDDKQILLNKTSECGEIALCNLASINIYNYERLNKNSSIELVNILVRGLDNTVDIATYPVLEGKNSNINWRYLGIGVLNVANHFASKGIVIDSQEALELTHEIFDRLSYQIINASLELSKIKGAFKNFNKTKWADGLTPIHLANKNALKLTKYQPDMEKWNKLGEEIKKFGIRNAQLMAIAPTATSGKAINATESIEPVQHFVYKEDGKINLPTLVPNIVSNWKYYKLAFDCDQYMLIKAAAIRQMYIDQAQSINVYFKKITSLTDFSLFHFYGFMLGIKTYYYSKTSKEQAEEICESCS